MTLAPRTLAAAGAVILALTAGARANEQAGLAHPVRLSDRVAPGERHHDVRLLGTLALRRVRIDGILLTELSAIAWDEDEDRLYALSDNGALFHLRPVLRDGRQVDLQALAAYRLRDRHGAVLRNKQADSEGIAALSARNGRQGDTELLVSFERRPRVAAFSPDGTWLGRRPLPSPLDRRGAYASENRGLEALAAMPGHVYLAGPERPLRGAPQGEIRIRDARGGSWRYPLRDAPEESLVSMEAMPDGSVLTLERGHGSFYLPFYVTLRRIPSLPERSAGLLVVQDLAILSTARGWRIDNFEGLAWHRGARVFLVSDDNERRIQRTLLTYLEILPYSGAAHRTPEFEPRHDSPN